MAQAAVRTSTTTDTRTKTMALPRSMGFFATFVFAIATIGLASSGLTPFSTILGQYPGIPFLGILAAGGLICLVNAYVYSVIGAAVRRSGADYILASRVIHPVAAFALSFSMVIFSGLVLGKVIAQIAQSVLPVFMRSVSIIAQVPAMMLSADSIASPQGVSIAGAILVVIVFALSILPSQVNHRILQVGFGLVLLGWGVIFFQFLLPVSSFQQAWDHFMGVGTYEMQVQMARELGMTDASGSQANWIGGLLIAFWLYFGFQAPAFLAGEVKNPARNLFAASAGSVLLTLAVIGLGTVALFRLVPQDWLSAQSYLYLSGKSAMPWITFYAAILRPDPFQITFLTLVWVYSFINIVQAYFLICSRIILAWAEDGIVPSAAGYVHPRLKSPLVGVLVIAILTQLGVMVTAQTQASVSADFGFIFFAILTQLLPVLAALLMPFLKKGWFSSTGGFVRARIGPLPLISLFSLVLLGYFGWLLFEVFSTPAIFAQASLSFIVLGIVFVAGILIFLLRWLYKRSKGIDLMETFRSFPNPHD